jgi:CBS domain-containing protein
MIDVKSIMSTELVTIAPDDTLGTARQMMTERKIHHLPVTDKNSRLVGLITLTDLLAATDSILRDDDGRLSPEAITVAEVMVQDIATVDERADLRQAALFLERHRIGCLPVVTDGKLRGIVTDTDFVAVAINLLEQLELNEEQPDFEEL